MRRGEEFWSTSGDITGVTDQWREMLSATHLPWSVAVGAPARGARPFEATVRRWWIDDLALVDCSCGPCSGTRTRREMASTDGEFVVVLISLAGREAVAQGDSEADLRPGDAVVWDSTRPARFAVPVPLSKRSLLVPRAALDEVSGRAWVTGGVMLDGTEPATRLLTSYLATLSAALPELGAASVASARNATLELLVGALRAGSEVASSSVAQPALRAAIDRYIERHLIDSALEASAAPPATGSSGT